MKQSWITRSNNRRLIVIFLGWGADVTAFKGLSRPGYDILAVWDYRDESLSMPTENYCEVCVIAWSFGVFEAARMLEDKLPSNVTLLIAVNGTEQPVDNKFGIPVEICEGTLENLNERNLRKFYRRMFASKEAWDSFSERLPQRNIEELTDELRLLYQRALVTTHHLPWTLAYISDADAIFPAKNQLNYWEKMAIPCFEIESGHFPNWHAIIDHIVVDKEYVAQRFDTAAKSYDAEAELQCKIALNLWQLTREHLKHDSLKNVLEIGCGSGMLTHYYLTDITPAELWLWDISPRHSSLLKGKYNENLNIHFKQCDAEIELQNAEPESLDLIISSSTIQWFHSPDRFLRNAAKALRKGGVLAFSTFGPQMCTELKEAGISTRHYYNADAPIWRSATSDLELINCENSILTKCFDTPTDVFRHMRRSGVNALRRTPISTAEMRRAIDSYPVDGDGKATLTFNPLYFIYRKI